MGNARSFVRIIYLLQTKRPHASQTFSKHQDIQLRKKPSHQHVDQESNLEAAQSCRLTIFRRKKKVDALRGADLNAAQGPNRTF